MNVDKETIYRTHVPTFEDALDFVRPYQGSSPAVQIWPVTETCGRGAPLVVGFDITVTCTGVEVRTPAPLPPRPPLMEDL